LSAPLERLLCRLEGTRQAGKGWTARCPAHADRTSSLSVAAGDDGRVLVHCFAGCAIGDVLAAVGLELADLFDRPLARMTPEARRELGQAGRMAKRIADLNGAAHELAVVVTAAGMMVADPAGGLDWSDYERLCAAHDRLAAILPTWRPVHGPA
jgi:hypothetical protein